MSGQVQQAGKAFPEVQRALLDTQEGGHNSVPVDITAEYVWCS